MTLSVHVSTYTVMYVYDKGCLVVRNKNEWNQFMRSIQKILIAAHDHPLTMIDLPCMAENGSTYLQAVYILVIPLD